MSEENGTPAETQAAEHTQPASAPAEHHQEHYEQPAHEETPADYEEPEHEQHDQEGEQPERPKKLSGAQRAKLQKEWLQNELSAREHALQEREQRIQELEKFINERDANDRQSESERQAEAKRKRDEAHLDRIKASKTTIRDFDRVLRSMDGVPIHMDLVEDIKASDKSELLTYHLANNPKKLDELNHMSDRERVRELGRLEATLKIPEGKKQTKAPPPPSNLKGGAAPHANPNTGPADMNNFAAWLKKDLARRSGR